MNEILTDIKGLGFFTAEQLIRDAKIPRRLANIIRQQPGYAYAKQCGYEMAISQTKNGEWRLYSRVDGQWMDGSLHNMLDDINKSDAAAALGSVKSEKKAKSSVENGKKGGRPRKQQEN